MAAIKVGKYFIPIWLLTASKGRHPYSPHGALSYPSSRLVALFLIDLIII